MKKETITREQFNKLRNGDVVIWGYGTHRMIRTVLAGPADKPDARVNDCVTFPISRRSWTGGLTTVYSFTDMRRKIQYTGKRYTEMLASPQELERLAQKFDLPKQLKKELSRTCRATQSLQSDRHWRKRAIKTFEIVKEVYAES